MNIRNLIYQIKPPCSKCPYKLGEIRTPINPCLQCKLNDYRDYVVLKRRTCRKEG